MNSSDDEGSPEAVSLSISKKTAASKRAALHNAQTQEALKKKEKNREKDRRLKEQAASSRDDLEARMERAMQEAQEESSEEDSVAEEKGLVVLGDPVSDEEEEEEILPQKIRFDADKDEDMDSGEEPANPNHLPDHIFAAAFAQKPTPKEAKPKSIPPRNKKTPKRKKQSAKDLVLGYAITCSFAFWSDAVRQLEDNPNPFCSIESHSPAHCSI